MNPIRIAVVVLGAVLAAASLSMAAPPAGAGAAARLTKAKAAPPAATHSMRGVVKTIDATTLVVERKRGKNAQDMTFALGAATHRDAAVKTGSMVTVRYRSEAQKLVALDVAPVKTPAVARKTANR